MTYGNRRYKVGDVVSLHFGDVIITHLHSGYYDFQYTGKCVRTGKLYYFDDEII